MVSGVEGLDPGDRWGGGGGRKYPQRTRMESTKSEVQRFTKRSFYFFRRLLSHIPEGFPPPKKGKKIFRERQYFDSFHLMFKMKIKTIIYDIL